MDRIIERYNKLTNRDLVPEHTLRLWARDAVVVIHNLRARIVKLQRERCSARNEAGELGRLVDELKERNARQVLRRIEYEGQFLELRQRAERAEAGWRLAEREGLEANERTAKAEAERDRYREALERCSKELRAQVELADSMSDAAARSHSLLQRAEQAEADYNRVREQFEASEQDRVQAELRITELEKECSRRLDELNQVQSASWMGADELKRERDAAVADADTWREKANQAGVHAYQPKAKP